MPLCEQEDHIWDEATLCLQLLEELVWIRTSYIFQLLEELGYFKFALGHQLTPIVFRWHLWHCVTLFDIVSHCVTFCDIVWHCDIVSHCVTLCDIVWHCFTLCDIVTLCPIVYRWHCLTFLWHFCQNIWQIISTITQHFHFQRLLESVQYNTHPIDSLTKPVDPNKNLQLTEVTMPMLMMIAMTMVAKMMPKMTRMLMRKFQIGSAVYPTVASCVNHSCDPATLRHRCHRHRHHHSCHRHCHRHHRCHRWYFDCRVCQGHQIALLARRKIEVFQS